MPSRRNSFTEYGRLGLGNRSKSFIRDCDGDADDDEESAVDSGIGASVAGDEKPETLPEGSDEEGDVTNGMLMPSTP